MISIRRDILIPLILTGMSHFSFSGTLVATSDWIPYEELTLDIKTGIAPYCSGVLIEPSWPGLTVKSDNRFSPIVMKAEIVSEDQQKILTASGNVLIRQDKIQLEADRIYFDPKSTSGTLANKVKIRIPGVLMESSSGQFQLNKREVELFDTKYAFHNYKFSGLSNNVVIIGNKYKLNNAMITRCDPRNPEWSLKAKSLSINRDKGSAVATHARVNIGGIPILYLPYLSFPIDDRRQTGFLMPYLEFGIGGDDIESLQIPFYWNIAPQLDNTLIPYYQASHGWFMQNETRYIGKNYKGQSDIGWSPDSQRWMTEITHQYNSPNNIQYDFDWNHYSDNLAPVDFNDEEDPIDYAHQGLKMTSDWRNINYRINVERWQTIKGATTLADKPYAAQPGLTFSESRKLGQKIVLNWTADITNFDREATPTELLTLNQSNGETAEGWREAYTADFRIPYEISKLQITPELKVSAIGYQLETPGTAREEKPSFVVPKAILNLTSVHNNKLGHSEWNNQLTPKAVFVYSPYVDQYKTPVFDSEEIDFDKDQLFKTDRYTGMDRIGDMNRVSVGFTNKISNPNKEQQLTFDVGQIIRLADEKLGLTQDLALSLQDLNSPIYSSVIWDVNPALTLSIEQNWNSNEDRFELQSYNMAYRPNSSALLNLEYTYGWEDSEWNDDLHFSAVLPIGQRWGFATALDYNFTDDVFQDTLIGLEYDNCCWNLRILSKLDWTDFNETIPVKNSLYLQLYLKGLGQNNEILDDLLAERIPGYQGRLYP